MKHVLKFIFILAPLLLSVEFSQLNAKAAEKQLQFSFDDRVWEKGFENASDGEMIIEYTLKGETVHDWTELVTVQKFPATPMTPLQFYKNFIASFQAAGNKEGFNSKIIEKGRSGIFFEWTIAKGPSAEHEWLRLLKTPQATWVLKYTTKKLNEVDKVRPIWEKILNEAKLAKVS